MPAAESALLKRPEVGEQPKLDAIVLGRGSFVVAKYLVLTHWALTDTLAIKSNQYSDTVRQMQECSITVIA